MLTDPDGMTNGSEASDMVRGLNMNDPLPAAVNVYAVAFTRGPQGRTRYACRPWPRLIYHVDGFCSVSGTKRPCF